MNLYIKIKDLCIENDISVKFLEQSVGISSGTISKWATSIPSADKLDKVAEYFNVSTPYLLGKTEDCGSYLNNKTTLEDPMISHKTKVFAHNIDVLPSKDRDKLIKIFEDILDIYLQARGIQKSNGSREE